jgi:hypothetical protein
MNDFLSESDDKWLSSSSISRFDFPSLKDLMATFSLSSNIVGHPKHLFQLVVSRRWICFQWSIFLNRTGLIFVSIQCVSNNFLCQNGKNLGGKQPEAKLTAETGDSSRSHKIFAYGPEFCRIVSDSMKLWLLISPTSDDRSHHRPCLHFTILGCQRSMASFVI